jgi:hypothetical protein
LIDRCYHIFGRRTGGSKHVSNIYGKRQALVMTTPDLFDNNAEPLLMIFNRMIARSKAQSAGVLFVCNCSTPEALGEDIKNQSIRFAKNMFGKTGTPYPVFIPGADNRVGL